MVSGMGRVGERLREYRKERSISVRRMARDLAMSHTALSNQELGKAAIDADDLPRYADYLGISPAAFYDDEELTYEQIGMRRLAREWRSFSAAERDFLESMARGLSRLRDRLLTEEHGPVAPGANYAST